jgi:predicted CXXCH cytochrome family protein
MGPGCYTTQSEIVTYRQTSRTPFFAWWLIVVIGVILALCWSKPAQAATEPPPDSACRLCHIGMDEEMTLPSGETLSVGVDPAILDQSVHGVHMEGSAYCTDCHQDRRRYQYPHQPNPAQDLVQFVAEIAGNCEQCHLPLELHNPGHLEAMDNPNVPNCVNCHGGHDVEDAGALMADPVAMCLGCHENFEEPATAAVHAQFMENWHPDQNCQTCHDDQVNPTTDTECKDCHTMVTEAVSEGAIGVINPHVDLAVLQDSVHGAHQFQGQDYGPVQCTDCHNDLERYDFPHAPLPDLSPREMKVEAEAMCQDCHTHIFDRHMDSVHAVALADGNLEAATCIDCHGSHSVQDPDEPRERISNTCGECHTTEHEQYVTSVHGAALLGEQNPDVAVCTDCHGVHKIEDPTTAQFRLNSPQLCAECHADEPMMAKYDISTDVFETYVADFHGTTVTLFEQQSPDQETNSAVCYDCHGVHNILPANDENSQVIKENLLTTCQQCHPNASANFPDAWMSHFRPSWDHNRIVYVVDIFYKIFIPTVLGGFLLFIGTDVYHRYGVRARRRKQDEL